MLCKYAYVDNDDFLRDPYTMIKCKHPDIIPVFDGKCKSQRYCPHKGRQIISEQAMFYCSKFKQG